MSVNVYLSVLNQADVSRAIEFGLSELGLESFVDGTLFLRVFGSSSRTNSSGITRLVGAKCIIDIHTGGLSEEELRLSIFHELVHAKQFVEGRLSFSGSQVLLDGNLLDNVQEEKHETEAESIAIELLLKYKGHINNDV